MIFSNTKHWLEAFLVSRNNVVRPDGRRLYKYNVYLEEYELLKQLLCSHLEELSHPLYGKYWAASFCLFVAEKYRREYDGSQGGWSWQGFDNEVGGKLSHQEHSQIVKDGMSFWKRPIKERNNGLDYLGTLFTEGGLPWKLLQTDRHSFGRAVSGGLRKYYRSKYAGRDLIGVIREYETYFPSTFRNIETLQLIASIIEHLIRLAGAHELEGKADPADYLDSHDAEWRKSFPIPIGEENARILVNEWLIDAGKSRREIKSSQDEVIKGFSCQHRLTGELSDWQLETEAFLPKRISIPLNDLKIQGIRLELMFYEDEECILNAGVTYARIDETRNILRIEFPKLSYKLKRTHPDKPVMLQLFSSGQLVQKYYFEGSDVDWKNLPLIFEGKEDNFLLGTASTVVLGSSALILMPQGAYIEGREGDVFEVATDAYQRLWLEINDDVLIRVKELLINVRLNGDCLVERLSFEGRITLYNCLPKLTYQGWPALKVSEFTSNQLNPKVQLCVEGCPIINDYQRENVGVFNLSVVSESGAMLLRRKVGVLPSNFNIKTTASTNNMPARVTVHSNRSLRVNILNKELTFNAEACQDETVINLQVGWNQEPPEMLVAEVFDRREDCEPVIIRFPFPQRGYRLFNSEGRVVNESILSLDDLLGMRLILTSNSSLAELFRLVIEMEGVSSQRLQKSYHYKIHQYSESISLYSLYEDMAQMLAAVPDQDASIKLSIETDHLLGQLSIKRYAGVVKGLNSNGEFEIENFSESIIIDGVKPLAMRLSEPAAASVTIPENLSQGIGMGLFRIPEKMSKEGPWLIYPSIDSSVKFRPIVWSTLDVHSDKNPPSQVNTIHHAAKLFHPSYNSQVFVPVIEEMSEDMSHSGWGYFLEIQARYSHFALSSFESWRALNTSRSAMALAVFRLEIDESFCRRLTNELSVIWESITFNTWLKAQEIYTDYLVDSGLPIETVNILSKQRRKVLADKVPIFRHLESFINKENESGLPQQALPLELVIPDWYNDLRRRHAEGQWPEHFSKELTNWINQQQLPESIQRMSGIRYANAITYLPVFMAYVTAGKISLGDLSKNLPELKFGIRVLADFDREGWYEPVYSVILSSLLLEEKRRD